MPLIATLGNNSKKTSVLLMLIFRVVEKKIFKNVALKYYLGEYENNINDKKYE